MSVADKAFLTPQRIVKELDKHIIGQDEAKKAVAVALRDRWRRGKTPKEIRDEIVPSNILMVGPTGTGKSEIGRRMAKICNVPFVKVEASQYTETGYVGKDVKEIIGALAEIAVNIVQEEIQREIEGKVRDSVDNIILNILVPPVKKEGKDSAEENKETQELFLKKLKKGELDERSIDLEMQDLPNSIGLISSSGVLDESMFASFNNMMSKFMPPKTITKKVKIKEAKRILFESELEKYMDTQAIHQEAISRTEEGIVFIDEIDKTIGSSKEAGGPEVSRKGVQHNLLPIIEGTTVNTKIGRIKTDHILFIAAGAFHHNSPNDLMPEMRGRLPVLVTLNSLTQEDYARILGNKENSIIKQQQALLKVEDIDLHFTQGSIKVMAKAAHSLNKKDSDLGARRLPAIVDQVLKDVRFDIPEKIPPGTPVNINTEFVNKRLHSIIEEDISDYIL